MNVALCILCAWLAVECAYVSVVATPAPATRDTATTQHEAPRVLKKSKTGARALPHAASLEKNGVRLPPSVLDFVFVLDTSFKSSDDVFSHVEAQSSYPGLAHRFSLLAFDGCSTDPQETVFAPELSDTLEAVISKWKEVAPTHDSTDCKQRNAATSLRSLRDAMAYFAEESEDKFSQSHVHSVLSTGGRFDLDSQRGAVLSARGKVEAILRRHPTLRCSVSVVLDGEDASSIAVFGSPRFTDAFGDGSHFSPGATFQKMRIYEGEDSAADIPGTLNEYLQTAFIFRGLQFRVYDASEIHSMLKLPYNLQPQVGDVLLRGDHDPLAPHGCSLGDATAGGACGEGEFCSEVLGCLPDPDSSATEEPSVNGLDTQYVWTDGDHWVQMDVAAADGSTRSLPFLDREAPLSAVDIEAMDDSARGAYTYGARQALLGGDRGQYAPTPERRSVKPEVAPSPMPHKATHVKILTQVADPDDFVAGAIAGGEPVVFRAGLVAEWDAFPQPPEGSPASGDEGSPGSGDEGSPSGGDEGSPGSGDEGSPGSGDEGSPGWSFDVLREKLVDFAMENVYRTADEDNLFFSPDFKEPMANLSKTLDTTLPYESLNMTAAEFFESIAGKEDTRRYYWFGKVPEEELGLDLQPSFMLYRTEKDEARAMQYVWVGEAGVRTHAHFDQDWNFYVQVAGRKRFTLVPDHYADYMYPHPRIHPNWHKSQTDLLHPDLDRFPALAHLPEVLEAELEPGDVLFVPPNYWHHVETLEDSVSVTTWSRQEFIYDELEAIYGYQLRLDRIYNRKGRVCGLRLAVDMLVSQLFGVGKVSWYMDRLLRSRYSNMAELFPARRSDPRMCLSATSPTKVPTAKFLFSATKFDVQMLVAHFIKLPPVHREFLVADYIEQTVADIAGVESAYAFMRYCFRGQGYHFTSLDDDEHSIWT